jgi:hypothetical protein
MKDDQFWLGEYEDPIWGLFSTEPIRLVNMNREQCRNAMQWCIEHHCYGLGRYYKDGITTQEWELMFLIKLLDPDLP